MHKIDLENILKKIAAAKVGVIGDFCLDAYWIIDNNKSEISIETKLSTKPVTSQHYSLGGAGNVASNLTAMGVRTVLVFGVTGDDPFGYKMRALMASQNINQENLIEQKDNWSTNVYIKPIEENRELNRIDFGNYNKLSDETAEKLINKISSQIKNLDVVIINQQVLEGIHNSEIFHTRLKRIITAHPAKLFLLDSRNCAELYQNTIRKLNSYEALTLCGVKSEPDCVMSDSDAVKAACLLHEKWENTLFVTRGSKGCIVLENNKTTIIPCPHVIGKTDTVGAGDSMLAGIAAAMACGFDPITAATFGGFVAGVTVQKLHQTGTASPDEIRKLVKNI